MKQPAGCFTLNQITHGTGYSALYGGPLKELQELCLSVSVGQPLYAKRHAIRVFSNGKTYPRNACQIGINCEYVGQEHGYCVFAFGTEMKCGEG